ncbi:hypothetical protein VS877_22535, partial [Salmonella enterica subsp. enterica serovar Paratyphi A]|nr:hypothetical protein [Salmonella enterica subsp. enterica serovar Paratyphi A]
LRLWQLPGAGLSGWKLPIFWQGLGLAGGQGYLNFHPLLNLVFSASGNYLARVFPAGNFLFSGKVWAWLVGRAI